MSPVTQRSIAAVLLVLAGQLTACRGDSLTAPSTPDAPAPVASLSRDSMMAILGARGFPADLVKEHGDRFFIDGDIMVSKSSLEAAVRATGGGLRPSAPSRQYSTTNTANFGSPYALSGMDYLPMIGIDLSALDAQAPTVSVAVRGAITNWDSSPGSRVTFVEGTGYSEALTVYLGPCDSNPNTIACADFPWQECSWTGCITHPGATIQVTSTFFSLSSAEQLFALTHEMGHTIGLRHTNWNNRLCGSYPNWYACSEGEQPYGAVLIPGTPASTTGGASADPGSVMNATVLPWAGFTAYDRIAFRYLWPYGPGPAAGGGVSDGHPLVTWSAMQDASSYDVYRVIPPNCGMFCYGPAAETQTYVGSTTGTSFVDVNQTTSGLCTYFCWSSPGYRVKAHFPDNGRESALGAVAYFPPA